MSQHKLLLNPFLWHDKSIRKACVYLNHPRYVFVCACGRVWLTLRMNFAVNLMPEALWPLNKGRQTIFFSVENRPRKRVELLKFLRLKWMVNADEVHVTAPSNVINLAFLRRKCSEWIYHYAKCLFHASLINICCNVWGKKYGKAIFDTPAHLLCDNDSVNESTWGWLTASRFNFSHFKFS